MSCCAFVVGSHVDCEGTGAFSKVAKQWHRDAVHDVKCECWCCFCHPSHCAKWVKMPNPWTLLPLEPGWATGACLFGCYEFRKWNYWATQSANGSRPNSTAHKILRSVQHIGVFIEPSSCQLSNCFVWSAPWLLFLQHYHRYQPAQKSVANHLWGTVAPKHLFRDANEVQCC